MSSSTSPPHMTYYIVDTAMALLMLNPIPPPPPLPPRVCLRTCKYKCTDNDRLISQQLVCANSAICQYAKIEYEAGLAAKTLCH